MFFFLKGQAQVQVYQDYMPEAGFLYKKERSFEVFIHTSGWGIGYRDGKNVNRYKYSGWEGDFSTMRPAKQKKVLTPGSAYDDYGYPYRVAWGRMNQLFMFRGGKIWRINLAEKPDQGGVRVDYIFGSGIALGLAKPQYLYILYPIDNPVPGGHNFERRTERYDPNNEIHHNPEFIYGAAPFINGLSKISLHPGIYAKFGFLFEFGKYADQQQGIEAGIKLEGLFPSVQRMAYQDAQYIFFNFYLSYRFGKAYMVE